MYLLDNKTKIDTKILNKIYEVENKDDLLNLGFTKQDMDGLIADKYEELVKQKEENTDD